MQSNRQEKIQWQDKPELIGKNFYHKWVKEDGEQWINGNVLKAIGNINDEDWIWGPIWRWIWATFGETVWGFWKWRSGNNIASAFGNDIKNIIIGSNVLATSFSQWVY